MNTAEKFSVWSNRNKYQNFLKMFFSPGGRRQGQKTGKWTRDGNEERDRARYGTEKETRTKRGKETALQYYVKSIFKLTL